MMIPVLIFNNSSGKFPLDFCIGLRKNEWNKIILLSNCFFYLGLGTLIRITAGQLNRNLNSNIFCRGIRVMSILIEEGQLSCKWNHIPPCKSCQLWQSLGLKLLLYSGILYKRLGWNVFFQNCIRRGFLCFSFVVKFHSGKKTNKNSPRLEGQSSRSFE